LSVSQVHAVEYDGHHSGVTIQNGTSIEALELMAQKSTLWCIGTQYDVRPTADLREQKV
jgi:hypothetical protein